MTLATDLTIREHSIPGHRWRCQNVDVTSIERGFLSNERFDIGPEAREEGKGLTEAELHPPSELQISPANRVGAVEWIVKTI